MESRRAAALRMAAFSPFGWLFGWILSLTFIAFGVARLSPMVAAAALSLYSVARLVRIRIYGIAGFTGFRQLVLDGQALIRIGKISGYGEKRKASERNPQNGNYTANRLAVIGLTQ